MRMFTSKALALLCLAGGAAVAEHPAGSLSQWDVEGMYVQARAMLEDRSIQKVSSVPVLLETCVREGHPEAARLLMDVYEGKFKGLEPSPRQAMNLVRGLAEADALDALDQSRIDLRTEAMYRLALYLEKGNGCKPHPADAYKWMQRAAKRGMPRACVEESRYLINGTGVKKNPEQAWKQLHQQARTAPETPHLFFYMGHMCMHGLGVPRSPRKAFELFRMGAKLNDDQCLNNLGTMFEKGYPTPRNYENAYRLYRKAANLGNKEASANMQRLAFKEGIRASNKSYTPYNKRIDNATGRILQALPVSADTRDRLRAWLLITSDSEDS